jgi:predicted RNase H-like nuclease (RuvC/YqgF family)
MKKLLVFIALIAAACAAEPVVTLDLYGNVFLNGENTNKQAADFARNNPELASQVDGAVRELYVKTRKQLADDLAAKDAEKAAAIAAEETKKVAAIAEREAQRAERAAKVYELQAKLDELQARLAEKNAKIDELQAELASLRPPSP